MYEALKTGIHYEPLRPHRSLGIADTYEFARTPDGLCVYDLRTMTFIKEIKIGAKPDCHATSLDNTYLYAACYDGLACINLKTLALDRLLDIGRCYATNTLPDGNTLLVHDLSGGVILLKDITDMEKIHQEKRIQVIPNGEFRCEIGGKGHFIRGGRYYLCNGWLQSKIYLFDMEDGFSFDIFVDEDPRLYRCDDLVINASKTKAYAACHGGNVEKSHVAVIDIENKRIAKLIETGVGSCGLTMTNDERYAVVSNDQEDSISVIDTYTDTVINTPCAHEGFEALGLRGYIQGISCGQDNSIFVYGCAGNGALVRFYDIANSNHYVIATQKGTYVSDAGKVIS